MTQRICHQYPIRREPWFLAQVVLPRDLKSHEADRLCAFVMTLAQPDREVWDCFIGRDTSSTSNGITK
jgi:hypothetical protein